MFFQEKETAEEIEKDDEDATFNDDILDEVVSSSDLNDEDGEGDIEDIESEDEEEVGKKELDYEEEEDSLEDDAEDVDYDSFDDKDEI